jgi:hypothetical protein
MKIGLKLCSVLMVLPLVMGVQKHHSDSLYTDLTIGAGGGSYGNTFYTRTYTPGSGTGCDGSGSGGYWTPHENREKITYKDGGIGLETTTSKKTKLGIRVGYVKDTRIEIHNETYTSKTKTSYIINPHFSFEWEGMGIGAGLFLATEGLYYPSFNRESYNEDYFTGNDRSKTILPSFHLRLGSPRYLYVSVSHLENIPIVSGGGHLNYGVGTEAIPHVSLWAGYCDKKPFEKGSFLLKGGLKLSKSLSLNFTYRPSVETQGVEIFKPIRESAFSIRLSYRFFR